MYMAEKPGSGAELSANNGFIYKSILSPICDTQDLLCNKCTYPLTGLNDVFQIQASGLWNYKLLHPAFFISIAIIILSQRIYDNCFDMRIYMR